MPYIQRNRKGDLTGIFAIPQEKNQEFLEDADPEIIAFKKRNPFIPPPPLTEEEITKIQKQNDLNREEYIKLGQLTLKFSDHWHNLELALCGLLYATLNINPKHSIISHAVYFTPPGFDGRIKIVKNAVNQLIAENIALSGLIKPFKKLCERLQKIKDVRNEIAHGHIYQLNVNGVQDVKLRSPAFDILRVQNKINNKSLPGKSSLDLSQDIQEMTKVNELIDSLNVIITYFFENTLRQEDIENFVTSIDQ
jgi:hypothetical protein